MAIQFEAIRLDEKQNIVLIIKKYYNITLKSPVMSFQDEASWKIQKFKISKVVTETVFLIFALIVCNKFLLGLWRYITLIMTNLRIIAIGYKSSIQFKIKTVANYV